ncbi:MAG: hypothetical protein AAFQ02_06120 [Bacteroidota bacterium]
MRNVIIALLAVFMVAASAQAQGKKSLKAASKSLSEFDKDPFTNTEALASAKSHLEEAFQDEEVASDPRSWVTRGEILSKVIDSQIKGKILNPEAQLTDATAAIESASAFTKAIELADAKGDKKAMKGAIKGLRASQDLLNNVGAEMYTAQDFGSSYANFSALIGTHDALKSAGSESLLDDEAQLSEKAYFAGLTAYYAKDFENTVKFIDQALETGTSEAVAYQIMYEAHNKMGNDAAITYLEKGRELFPDDNGLLFTEINYYLAKGELDQMVGKLEEALAKEPDNVSVTLTLGQVYDQLITKASEAGETEKVTEYFEKALGYYERVTNADPQNFDAHYSLGALYYNRAAELTPSLNDAANDFSAAGTKKYDEIKERMSGFFDQALPYFLKADEINSEDSNTLIALKEIYVRKDDFKKSNEYKERLEALGSE